LTMVCSLFKRIAVLEGGICRAQARRYVSRRKAA
jgi:hypothetical protein